MIDEQTTWFLVLAGIATLLSSAEWTRSTELTGKGGLLDPEVVRLRHTNIWNNDALNTVLISTNGFAAIHTARAAVAVTLIPASLIGSPRLAGIAAAFLGASQLILFVRHEPGWDGADQLLAHCLLATGLALLVATDTALLLARGFIAAQVVLAYTAAGAWKIASPAWRTQPVIAQVIATRNYGLPSVGRRLAAHSKAVVLLGWIVIIWEVTAPVWFLAPQPIISIALGIGFVFHASNAILMGLGPFFLAFTATYPTVATVSHEVRNALGWS